MSITGTAKIVTNEGDGRYTITQTFIDTSDTPNATFKTRTVGLVAVEAWDVNLDATRSVDDKVVFQMQESYDGKSVPVILAGGGEGSDGDDIWIEVDGTINQIGPQDTDDGAGPPVSNPSYSPIDGDGLTTLCSPIPVCDDRGNIQGWIGLSGGVYSVAQWYSPWGFAAPASLPLDGTRP